MNLLAQYLLVVISIKIFLVAALTLIIIIIIIIIMIIIIIIIVFRALFNIMLNTRDLASCSCSFHMRRISVSAVDKTGI